MSIFSKNYSLCKRAAMYLILIFFSIFTFQTSLSGQCAATTAYTGTVTTGNQNWTGKLGQEFTNTVPIQITQLGVFDDATVAGLTGNITVGIVNDAGATVVGPIVMTGSADPLVASYRMRAIAPVILPAGTYHIVAVGFGAADPNSNSGLGGTASNTNSGGILTFGLPRYDAVTIFGGRPTTVDAGPNGRYHAGTFSFSAVQPILQTTLNGVVITTENDGADDTADITVCNDNVVNITLGTFTDLAGSLPADYTVKAYMEYTGTNVNFTGVVPGDWVFSSARRLSDYPGFTAILSKVNINLAASATLRWRTFVDSNLNGLIDAGECPGDWATYNITFETTPPTIVCPDDIEVQADPTLCAVVVNYEAPTASDDPCTTILSIVQTSGLASGAEFPVGVTTNVFLVTDGSGNTNTCSFTVEVLDYQAPPLGCKQVQLSLDEDCEGVLEPTTVLTGWEGPAGEVLLGCEALYTINVKDKNGFDLGNTLTRDQLGKTLQYTITHTSGFTCWGDVTIEDKIKPTIVCRDVEVHCLTDLTNVGIPVVNDNCHARAELVNEVHELLDCDPLYVGTITRTWIAVDDFGNESLPCTSVINLLRPTAASIVPPAINVKLSCSSGYETDDKGLGFPSPDETGTPTLGGTVLYPTSQLNMLYCNAVIDYVDDLLVDTDCKKRIRRVWTISEWWCSTMNPIFVGAQIIDIVDEIAPVIPVQADITVTTQTRSCSAAVQLPTLNITDNCNKVYRVYVNAYNGGIPSGYVNGNGGLIELGVGTHTITYTAFDNCTNSSTMSYRVTVRDETDPVAICDQFATVSIKDNGYTDITAQAVDDGSFDECGPVTLKLRRMEDPCAFGQDTAWYDKVGFCCLDANTSRMVQLLVTDLGGNTNICMVTVNIQEKVNPTISCPANMIVEDCLFAFDPSLSGANAAFGAAVINDNCPANNTLNHTLVDNRNQCGTGTVVRTFSVQQNATVYQTCTQTITFENNEPFDGEDIEWPKDYLALGQCSFSGLLPETLPDSSSVPVFTEDACDLVGTRYEDLVFPFTTNGACYKIIRTWTVIDWCQTGEDGNNLTWTHEQEIKVMDNNKPVITVPVSPVIFETLSCFSDEITLSASAVDCTPSSELKWAYEIYQDNEIISSGNASSVTDEFEVGSYTISFVVEDRCGNVAKASYDFVVETTKAPTAICKNGLAAPLVLMDTDGNGTGDTPMVMLTPSFFDNKSNHPCGYNFELSFSADVTDQLVTFNCSDVLDNQIVQLWVTDENGNTSYCETYVDIQDTGGLCPSSALSVVSGKTVTEDNKEIANVDVDMDGSEQNPVSTDQFGRFVFSPIVNGGNYQIVPGKDGDDLNGVSTLDLVMIQRHILGLEKLSSPYKLIAADVNNNKSIAASDLTELRKLILGVNKEFAANSSWRFVDGSKKFADPNDPWNGGLQEVYAIDKLSNNMDINFIGIKVGDVNGNVVTNLNQNNTESRSSHTLQIKDRNVMRGEIVEIQVMADKAGMIYGLQTQLNSNGLIIRDIKGAAMSLELNNYVIPATNIARMSVTTPQGVRVTEGRVLFTIEAEVLKSGLLSEMLSINREFASELYTNNLEVESFNINWRKEDAAFALTSVTPNPWNVQTQISFELPQQGMVTFKVRDYTGKSIISTIDQYPAGQNVIQMNSSDLGQPGVYIYELRFGDKLISGKMILIE